MNLIITGGAGYIGSLATRRALDQGHKVCVVDDLSHGYRKAVDPRAEFVELSTGQTEKLTELLRAQKTEAVLHFAAFIEVGESVQDPLKYYENNVSNAVSLLKAMQESKVRKLVFSSTAAVYGNPVETPIKETHAMQPINPYGESKATVEKFLRDQCAAHSLATVSLRYFNVAGAAKEGDIGESHEPETHLIPRILSSAQDDTAKLHIFGTDYKTRDGTCVRDYVHIEDLVSAHLLALNEFEAGEAQVFNLGSQQGFTVKEVISASEKVTGKKIQVTESDRRPGDPPTLVASSEKAREVLGWEPQFPNLETIIEDAWRWHQSHPRGFRD